MVKLVAISDTHGQLFHDKVPECDILIHCGDVSPARDHSIQFQKIWLYDNFISSLPLVPAKHIVFVGGNHDFYLYNLYKNKLEEELIEKLPSNVHYLRDSEITLEGIKIYGSPWVENLSNWAFNLNGENEKINTYSMIPEGLDILVSHAPAFKYCDTIMEYNDTENLGSKYLAVEVAKKKPKLVLTGHIHSGNHKIENMIGKDINNPDNIKFRCVSLLDESYSLHYEPFVFQYDVEKKNFNF
jgi:Icc-related predicted phosphoesterase